MKYTIRQDEIRRIGGHKLFRIYAAQDFTAADGREVKAGDKGGCVESEENLSQEGTCWVADEAAVYGKARVFNDAIVKDKATIYEYGSASGKSVVSGEAAVFEMGTVQERAVVSGTARVFGKAVVGGDALVKDAAVGGDALVKDKAKVTNAAFVRGAAGVYGQAEISGHSGGGGQNVRAYAECFVCEKATDILIIGSGALVRYADEANVSPAEADDDCNRVFGDTESLPAYIDNGVRYFISDDVGDDTYFRVSFPLGERKQDITDNIEHGLAIVDADSVRRGNSDALRYGVLVKDFCGSIEMQRGDDGTEKVCGRGSNIFDIDIINGNDQNPLG